MVDEFSGKRPRDREGFVLWIERATAHELRGAIERTANSDRRRFRSGEELLRILTSAANAPRPPTEDVK